MAHKWRKFYRNTHILNEELGISKEVYDETNEIIDGINEILKDKTLYHNFRWNDNDDSTLTYGVDVYSEINIFDDYVIDVMIRICILSSEDELNYAINNFHDIEEYAFIPENNMLLLQFPVYKPNYKQGNIIQIGIKNTKIRGFLSHEIKHAYQHFKKIVQLKNTQNKDINIIKKKDTLLYKKSIQLIRTCNGFKRLVGFACYYTFPVEITANVQKLWQIIKQDAIGDYDRAKLIIKESDYNKKMKMIKNLIKSLDDNTVEQSDIDFLENHYNMSINDIINRVKYGYKRLLRGYGRIMTMIEKYFNK